MKKTLIIIAIIITIIAINKEEKQIIIPKNSIRFRVIASSNTKKEQDLKKKIVVNLKNDIKQTSTAVNIKEARNLIIQNLPKFEETIENTLKKEQTFRPFTISYGKNYFPEKEYKNVIYKEGEYESLVVTLGDGKGKNFWCVLFPPLCLIDENSEVEYKSLIKEVLDKYL